MRPENEDNRRQFGSVTVSNDPEDKEGLEGEDKTPDEPEKKEEKDK